MSGTNLTAGLKDRDAHQQLHLLINKVFVNDSRPSLRQSDEAGTGQ
jgi:hypothetical protein